MESFNRASFLRFLKIDEKYFMRIKRAVMNTENNFKDVIRNLLDFLR